MKGKKVSTYLSIVSFFQLALLAFGGGVANEIVKSKINFERVIELGVVSLVLVLVMIMIYVRIFIGIKRKK